MLHVIRQSGYNEEPLMNKQSHVLNTDTCCGSRNPCRRPLAIATRLVAHSITSLSVVGPGDERLIRIVSVGARRLLVLVHPPLGRALGPTTPLEHRPSKP